MSVLTIAVAKGYLWDEAQAKFNEMGIYIDEDVKTSRKLSFYDRKKEIRFLIVRAMDVAVYVENGAADLGIVGQDVLAETSPDVIELLPLDFGYCRLVLAAQDECDIDSIPQNSRVASKYLNLTIAYFQKLGIKINPIKLYGAIELAPSMGLSDYVCDLSATGKTLKANGLFEVDTIMESTATLIANTMSLKYQYRSIDSFYQQIKPVCALSKS